MYKENYLTIYDEMELEEAGLQVHLFGIEYGSEIRRCNYKISKIVELSGLDKGFSAEVSKGVKLAPYVSLK